MSPGHRHGHGHDHGPTLRDCREGDVATVLRVHGSGAFRRRLIEMGFTPGSVVRVEKYAPLKDPVEFVLKGYHVSLRREEADLVQVEKPTED
ncbi:MAG: FeoA family protein [Candidatus Alcyoniella australis]|nr:FeoA family protein [Candidatus Alcyoniella australis]